MRSKHSITLFAGYQGRWTNTSFGGQLTKLHVILVCTRCGIDVTVLLQIGSLTQFLLFPLFVGSFGRAGSGEDVSDTGREQGDGDIQSPAEFWTAKIQRVQPGMRVVVGCNAPWAQPNLLGCEVHRYLTCFIYKVLVFWGVEIGYMVCVVDMVLV
jgi:hypothetical protein